MKLTKRGCAVIVIGVAVGLVALFCSPYHLETVEGLVSKNETRCVVRATNYSGWTSRPAVEAVK